MGLYTLMHKNIEVLLLNIDDTSGKIIDKGYLFNKDHLPLPLQFNIGQLTNWWNDRAVPQSRHGINQILHKLNVPNVNSLLLKNLALSLTDCYWVKPFGYEISWESVNLFNNDFSDPIGDLTFSTKGDSKIKKATKFSPNTSLQGELKKKWIIDSNSDRLLVKGNYGTSFQQSLNEYFASEINARQKNVPEFVKYSLYDLNSDLGKSIGCVCKNFCNENLEFISAWDLSLSVKKKGNISEYDRFIMLCVKNGLDEQYVRNTLEYQICCDFIISNLDRHYNNFGILRNPDTLEFISLAPLFDFGNSMFWNFQAIPSGDNLLKLKTHSFLESETKMLKYVTSKDIFDINTLPSDEFYHDLYSKDVNISEERYKKILNSYKSKIQFFKRFQNGEKIWEDKIKRGMYFFS